MKRIDKKLFYEIMKESLSGLDVGYYFDFVPSGEEEEEAMKVIAITYDKGRKQAAKEIIELIEEKIGVADFPNNINELDSSDFELIGYRFVENWLKIKNKFLGGEGEKDKS